VTVTWANVGDVAVALGLDTTGLEPLADPARLAQVTATANTWVAKRRFNNGYVDDPAVAPDEAVSEGVIKLACGLYRERGMYGGVASFSDAPFAGVDQLAQTLSINALIGCPRPMAV
jgi:hypothetical protein